VALDISFTFDAQLKLVNLLCSSLFVFVFILISKPVGNARGFLGLEKGARLRILSKVCDLILSFFSL
jgi:hypothetical protein